MFIRRYIQLFFAISLLLLAGAGAAGSYSAGQQPLPAGEAGISPQKNPLKDPERISPVSVSFLQLSVHKKVNGGEVMTVAHNGSAYTAIPAEQVQEHLNSHKAYLFFIYPSHHFW
jgi:hypothetical protein